MKSVFGVRKILVCVSIVWVVTAAYAQGSVPAKISGELSVSPSGAAVYRIPISLPPGVAGMEPKLALVYNSQNGNGPLGMGWDLDGLSAITRCPKTMATDGVRGALTHTPDDRFCMDGQRLINISGAYGAPSSEYRTEIESFSKIVANGAAVGNPANGPQSFTVKTKAGLTLEYGNTEDSRVEAQGKGVVRSWALNKIRDAKGNEIKYIYSEDSSSGEFNIVSIVYPGGGRVNFRYEGRPDNLARYESLSAIVQTKRVRQVITEVGGVEYRNLFLDYSQGSIRDSSLLTRVLDCDARSGVCLKPVDLKYGNLNAQSRSYSFGRNSGFAKDLPVVSLVKAGEWRFANIFPGGRQVFWARVDFTHIATRFNLDGTVQNWSWQGHGVGADGWQLADLFGEGRQVYWTRTGFTHFASRLNDDGTVQNWSWQGHGTGADGWQLADLFGDGRQVYWTRTGFTHYATRLNPDGTVQNWSWQGHGTGADGWRLADLFGDGRQVYWTRTGDMHYATRMNADGSVQNWSWRGHNTGADGWQLADLFGDGHHVYWTRSGFTHFATRLNPDGTVQNWSWQGHGTGADGWQLVDLFGDGRQVYWTRTGFTHYATRLNPDGTVQNWSWQGHGGGANGWQFSELFGDGRQIYWTRTDLTHFATQLNSDGTSQSWQWEGHGTGSDGMQLADVLGNGTRAYWTKTGAEHFFTFFSSGSKNRLMTVDVGGGSTMNIDYSASTGDINAIGGKVDYPVFSLPVPAGTVRSVTRGNGLDGGNTVSYRFGGLKSEHASQEHAASGRGSLGFQWMRSHEEATGIDTYTEFAQSWPYTGQLFKTETRMLKGGRGALDEVGDTGRVVQTPWLKQSEIAIGCYQTESAADREKPSGATFGCRAGPGKVYFLFPLKNAERSRDINGAEMPVIHKDNEYNGYADQGGMVSQFGDPTKIMVEINEGGFLRQRKVIVNQYQPAKTDGENWQSGRLIKSVVTSSHY